eukprot:INCI7220.6.p1 GENE.INCI7220.6~~INCI7220.6.p1  ORF type:complete len:325 (-),score=47.96 INCI7220.6:433-1407(-)
MAGSCTHSMATAAALCRTIEFPWLLASVHVDKSEMLMLLSPKHHLPSCLWLQIERLPLRYCRLPYGEKCLFWPQDGHWVFKNVLTQIERGKEVFKEKYGAPPDCVQIVTELRDPLYRTRSAFYAARARRAFFGNETKAQCPHIECHDDNALAMIENYNVTFEEALEGGMNYFRNMLSFYTGVNTQEGAKALYGSMSFVFRTTHLSHDVQIFGYKYGFNANIMSKFVTDFLDHSKTCSGLWKEPPTEERSATTIRNQNMLDEDIYQGGMEVWAPRWKHLNDVYAKKLKREHYECSKEIAGEECGSRGRNTCLLVKSLSKNKNNVR